MEYQTNKNSLNICMTYSYFSNLVKLNWNDILFAIENRYLMHNSAIEHAELKLINDPDSSQEVLDLVCLTPKEAMLSNSIYPYINKLADVVDDSEKAKSKDKIMYVLLNWIFENQETFDDPFKVIEVVYSDFDYPKSIVNFIGYMPMPLDELKLYTTPLKARERMIINWVDFLKKERKRFDR